MKRNLETGEMEQVADHNLKSKTVENFLNNKRSYCPVALIVGMHLIPLAIGIS